MQIYPARELKYWIIITIQFIQYTGIHYKDIFPCIWTIAWFDYYIISLWPVMMMNINTDTIDLKKKEKDYLEKIMFFLW